MKKILEIILIVVGLSILIPLITIFWKFMEASIELMLASIVVSIMWFFTANQRINQRNLESIENKLNELNKVLIK